MRILPLRRPSGLLLVPSGALLVALALACGGSGVAPDADADWAERDPDGQGGEEEEDAAVDEEDTGAADTGAVEEDDCTADDPVVFELVPQDTNALATPVQVRASLFEGWRDLGHVSVRAYEWLNYYAFPQEPAAEGRLSPELQLRSRDEGGREHALYVGVSSPWHEAEERPPLDLVISVDTSGSMSGEELDLARQVIGAVAGQLRTGDTVSLLSWDTEQRVILEHHAVDHAFDHDLLMATTQLEASGATDLESGLLRAYDLAEAVEARDRLTRVLLITDGSANVGQTVIRRVADAAGGPAEHGIFTLGVGVGDAWTYNDAMLDAITEVGRGASLFLSRDEDVEDLVAERFVELVDVAGLDVRLELVLPPGMRRLDRTPDPRAGTPWARPEPQDMPGNRTLVLHQTLVTDCPEAVDDDAVIEVAVKWYDPDDGSPQEARISRTIGQLRAGDADLLAKADAVIATTEALKLFRMGTAAQAEGARGQALDAVARARGERPYDADLDDLDDILAALAR
ncbi:MAG: VWA domain-containing protein [Alphaproteobacteria bacterium]|nr:VWA domain-containing protein [Alphaproteobacteria bacterium]